jgi:hypothetical protein
MTTVAVLFKEFLSNSISSHMMHSNVKWCRQLIIYFQVPPDDALESREWHTLHRETAVLCSSWDLSSLGRQQLLQSPADDYVQPCVVFPVNSKVQYHFIMDSSLGALRTPQTKQNLHGTAVICSRNVTGFASIAIVHSPPLSISPQKHATQERYRIKSIPYHTISIYCQYLYLLSITVSKAE